MTLVSSATIPPLVSQAASSVAAFPSVQEVTRARHILEHLQPPIKLLMDQLLLDKQTLSTGTAIIAMAGIVDQFNTRIATMEEAKIHAATEHTRALQAQVHLTGQANGETEQMRTLLQRSTQELSQQLGVVCQLERDLREAKNAYKNMKNTHTKLDYDYQEVKGVLEVAEDSNRQILVERTSLKKQLEQNKQHTKNVEEELRRVQHSLAQAAQTRDKATRRAHALQKVWDKLKKTILGSGSLWTTLAANNNPSETSAASGSAPITSTFTDTIEGAYATKIVDMARLLQQCEAKFVPVDESDKVELTQFHVFDPERIRVQAEFFQDLALMPKYRDFKFRITAVEKIENPRLKQRFYDALQFMNEQGYHAEAHPIQHVYHGTHPKNIHDIVRNNLSLSKAGQTDDGWFGRGLYFSRWPDYCMMYGTTGAMRPVQTGDEGRLIRFSILPGRVHHLQSMSMGKARMPLCDSVLSPNKFETILFDTNHCLPTYVIHFVVDNAPGNVFDGSIEQHGEEEDDE